MIQHNNYLEQVHAMRERLTRQPFIDVLLFQQQEGLPDAEITLLEQKYNMTLPDEVKDWYRHVNGLQLKWKANKQFGSTLHNGFLLYAEDVKGSINIMPLHDVISRAQTSHFLFSDTDSSFDNPFWFAGEAFTYNSFGRNLYPFDIYSGEGCMAINANANGAEAEVILLSDGYVSWNTTRCSSFAEYMNLILQVNGYEDARYELYNDPENKVRRKPDFDAYLTDFFLTLT